VRIENYTKRGRRIWSIWFYLSGWWVIAIMAVQLTYLTATQGPLWDALIAAALMAVSYVVAGWLILKLIVKPWQKWDVTLQGEERHMLQVTVHPAAGDYDVTYNGLPIRKGRSLKVAFDGGERIQLPIPDLAQHKFSMVLRTPWFASMRLSLEMDGKRLAQI